MAYQLPALPSPSAYDVMEKTRETLDCTGKERRGWIHHAAWSRVVVPRPRARDSPPDRISLRASPEKVVTKLLDVRLAKGTAYVQYEDVSGNKQVVEDTENFPIVNQRTGQIFGYPKDGYTIHPYLPVLKGFIESIVDDENLGIGSAGLLRKGGVAFLQAVLPETYEVAGYGYVPYFTAVTSADRTKKTTHGTGILGAVCDNTVNSSILGAYTLVATRHSRNSLPTLANVRDKLGIQLAQVGDEAAAGIENLLKVDVTDRQFKRWMDKMVPLVNEDGTPKEKNGLTIATRQRDQLEELWNSDPKAHPWQNTAFGVLQVANTQDTWYGTVRGADGGRMERNLTHAFLGKSAEKDAAAMTALAEVLRKKTLIAA